jgi:hypothetical protein
MGKSKHGMIGSLRTLNVDIWAAGAASRVTIKWVPEKQKRNISTKLNLQFWSIYILNKYFLKPKAPV